MAGERLLAEAYGPETRGRGDFPSFLPLAPLPPRRTIENTRRPASPMAPAEQGTADIIAGMLLAPYSVGKSGAEIGPNIAHGQYGPAALNALDLAMAAAFRRSPHLPEVWKGAHPRTTVEARTLGERPAGAATAYGDEVFKSPHIHGGEYDAAVAKLGAREIDRLANEGRLVDGFMTSTGRFLDRREAAGLADKTIGAPKYGPEAYRRQEMGLESNSYMRQLEQLWMDAKARGDQRTMDNLAAQYRDFAARIQADNATAYNRPMRLDEKIR